MARKCICFDVDTTDIDIENIVIPKIIDMDMDMDITCDCDEADLND